MNRRQIAVIMGGWLLVQPAGFGAELSFRSPITGARMHTSVDSLLEQRWKSVVRQGLDISCGSAALATILHFHFGNTIREDELIQAILKSVKSDEIRKRGGFSLLDLKRVATALGYRVQGYKLSFHHLVRLGGPSIVPVTIRRYKHFVVFRGLAADRVVLADPAFGNVVLSRNDFEQAWQKIALVLVKEGEEDKYSGLQVVEEDLPIPSNLEALAPNFYRVRVHSLFEPDAF